LNGEQLAAWGYVGAPDQPSGSVVLGPIGGEPGGFELRYFWSNTYIVLATSGVGCSKEGS